MELACAGFPESSWPNRRDALDMLEDRQTRRRGGWAGLPCGVVVKCVFEAVSGHILLESWHFGMLGAPIAVCHAGGVLGAFWCGCSYAPATKRVR
jgi:hypothetical protein